MRSKNNLIAVVNLATYLWHTILKVKRERIKILNVLFSFFVLSFLNFEGSVVPSKLDLLCLDFVIAIIFNKQYMLRVHLHAKSRFRHEILSFSVFVKLIFLLIEKLSLFCVLHFKKTS